MQTLYVVSIKMNTQKLSRYHYVIKCQKFITHKFTISKQKARTANVTNLWNRKYWRQYDCSYFWKLTLVPCRFTQSGPKPKPIQTSSIHFELAIDAVCLHFLSFEYSLVVEVRNLLYTSSMFYVLRSFKWYKSGAA